MQDFFTRRGFLAGATSLLAVLATPVWAVTEANARGLVDEVIGKINDIIASGKSEAEMIQAFQGIFRHYGDVPIMAKMALGVDGRRASNRQKQEFEKVFESYVARRYGKRFREFAGGKIEVKSARKIKAGYEVTTTALLRGSSPFEISFMVSSKSGKDLFFNMFIEGINLLLSERTEIGALIDRHGGDLDKMIADLKRLG